MHLTNDYQSLNSFFTHGSEVELIDKRRGAIVKVDLVNTHQTKTTFKSTYVNMNNKTAIIINKTMTRTLTSIMSKEKSQTMTKTMKIF